MTAPIRDLRYVLRALGRSPGYTVTCVAVLALAIGVNAAIFSFVYGVILKALPYEDPQRLVFLWQYFPSLPDPPFGRIPVMRGSYLEWRRQSTVFSGMGAFCERNLVEGGGERGSLSTGFASADFFPLLGVRPVVGRLFTADEEHAGRDRVAVITDAWFEKRFQRDPRALAGTVTLGGAAYSIIGVLPRRFHLPATHGGENQLSPDVWVPLSRLWNKPEDDFERQLMVVARLKPGASLEQARAEMTGIARRLEQSDPEHSKGWTVHLFPFAVEDSSPNVQRALLVLLAAVGFLLLIACANLANLTLARATLRAREVAVRLAMGATRARIIALLLTESLAVSLAGAAAGLLVAHWSIRLILAFKPAEINRLERVAINLPVLGFAVLAGVLTALLFGLTPAVAAARSNLHAALKSGGSWGASARRVRSRQLLIVAEVALALVLASGAGLMIRSLQQLVATGIGFDTSRLVTADIELPAKRYPAAAARSQYFRRLIERARALPGVTAAAIVDNLPLHQVSMSNFYIAGRPDPPLNALPMADMAHASPGYFSALGLRLLAGRLFTEADLAFTEKDGDAVVVVNQAFARRFFPGEDPLGKRLLNSDRKHAWEIVGVVSDYRPMGVENGTRPQIFWPYLKLGAATLVARTAAAPESFRAAIEKTARSVDAEVLPKAVKTLDEYLDSWQKPREFLTLLLVIFAALALILALMGIYGVLSSLVAARVREIGIRMALGASPAAVGRLVLRQSLLPVSLGLAAGLAGSLALSRFMQALLFQVHPRDPVTLGGAIAAILLVSPAAVYVPLRRATRVDCTVALREE